MFSSVLEQPELDSVTAEKPPAILIIDDDDALADVLSRCLRKQHYDTLVADSGELGLSKARSEHPALIVLDLGLPDTDGFAVCEELADSPDTCTIPVIILSGMEHPDMLRRCRAVGCYYFVRKPYDPNALLTLIRQAIRDTAAWGESDQ